GPVTSVEAKRDGAGRGIWRHGGGGGRHVVESGSEHGGIAAHVTQPHWAAEFPGGMRPGSRTHPGLYSSAPRGSACSRVERGILSVCYYSTAAAPALTPVWPFKPRSSASLWLVPLNPALTLLFTLIDVTFLELVGDGGWRGPVSE